MKRIYKRIEVASSEILLTLALFSDVGGAESVDAADLDRLEAQLSRPNYTGAEQLLVANVQRSHLEITNEGEVLAVLHRLKRGENVFVCKARYGTNISVQFTIDFVVTDPNETTPVEISEDVVLVESIGDGGGGGGEFPTDYAKQGTNPDATLTDTQAYAQSAASYAGAAKTAAEAAQDAAQAIVIPSDYSKQGTDPDATNTAILAQATAAATDAAAAKTAAQSLTSLDSDINAGKSAIALAVSSKGVPTSSPDTMLQMATNIQQIAQAPISINGGEMYATQLFGSLTTPNYWNLYDVMAQLLSDGRLNNYGGILLAEYFKGYDSLELSGAGAGGAYVVSDVDGNGNFIMYTNDTTHTWNTAFDGKGNRWVAYCFASAGHDFQITNADTSPRTILIGRNVGNIQFLANGRTSQIIVPDGNSLQSVDSSNRAQDWDKCVILRNLSQCNKMIVWQNTNIEKLYVSCNGNISSGIYGRSNLSNTKLSSVILKATQIGGTYWGNHIIADTEAGRLGSVYLEAETIIGYIASAYNISSVSYPNVCIIAESVSGEMFRYIDPKYIYFGYLTNNKTKSVIYRSSTYASAILVELQSGWCKNLDIQYITGITEDNIYTHILQRLKQDEPDCGDGVTITLGQTNLNKLTSAESVALLDDLTNIYGYTFA